MISSIFTRSGRPRQETEGKGPQRRGARRPPSLPSTDLLLDAEQRERLFGGLHRVGVLALTVELLRFVELGRRLLHVRVVGLHLGSGLLTLLDQGGALEGVGRAAGEGHDCRNCRARGHELLHHFTPCRAGLAHPRNGRRPPRVPRRPADGNDRKSGLGTSANQSFTATSTLTALSESA